jgi:hypothetical protein
VLLSIARVLEQRGSRVEVLRGIDHAPPADLLITQVDLSALPDRYRRFIARYPRLVKTNRNFCGQPERGELGSG